MKIIRLAASKCKMPSFKLSSFGEDILKTISREYKNHFGRYEIVENIG
jgi:hypothetical protein